MLDDDASGRHGCRLPKRYTEKGAAGNIRISSVFLQELQQRQEMGISLNLVQEDDRIIPRSP